MTRTIVLKHSDKADAENQGRGIPNYLGAAAISPDATQAWVPSKQDNIKRGLLRYGDKTGLNFQSTVRAISSRIALPAANSEDYAARIDHDNASLVERRDLRPARHLSVRGARDQPRGRGGQMRMAAMSCSASTSAVRLRRSPSPQTASGCTSTTSWTARSAYSTWRPLLGTGAINVPVLTTLSAGGHREADRDGAQRQAALLRCSRHASGTRPLHELRNLPQRWRQRRAGVGPDRVRRRPAQHDTPCAGAPPSAGVPALEQQLRRAAGLRRADPRAGPAAPA